MEKILISLIIILSIKCIFSQQENIYLRAKSKGFDLSDKNDMYFHDICISLDFIKKDITLDYRRKYYYTPNNNKKDIKFERPFRNNSNECFFVDNSIGFFFSNISLVLIIIFVIVLLLIMKILLCNKSDSIGNIPTKKLEKQSRNKNNNYNKIINENKNKAPYTKFTSEEKKENKKTDNNNIRDSKQMLKSDNSSSIFNEKDDNSQQKQNIENGSYEFREEETDVKFQIDSLKEAQEIEANNKNNLEEVYFPKEKSSDNYTFGVNLGTHLNKNNNMNNNISENKENVVETKGDKMKRIQKIYEEINPMKRKFKEDNSNINKISVKNDTNSDTFFKVSNIETEKIYVREEYFYFKYLLARIEDKRTLFQIYLDLLEYNQILFKFFSVPFNIYEDRKIQVVYHLTKIYLYFLINCLLIKSSVINDIYDEKNSLISDFLRSLKATLIISFIGLFLYKLTNVKRILIKRRYKIINLKISNKILLNEIIAITEKLSKKFLHHKILILFILVFLTEIYTFYVCFSFCKVYPHTQVILLRCIIFSIILSQTLPCILCWIPAFLRKKSLNIKSVKLYDITKLVEFFFIP